MSVLRIFDASQYISSGSPKAFLDGGLMIVNGEGHERTMASGGVARILDTVWEHLDEEDTDLVFCFDRSPTFKRELFAKKLTPLGFGEYKGNRPKKSPDIPLQREMAEEILKQIGINTVAVEGYEADDCIASIVEHYADGYDKVYIHTLDSDLFYLVSNKVEIAPLYFSKSTGQRGSHITLSNWEQTVSSKMDVTYNCLTIVKMCQGEPGDNIPRISRVNADKICYSIAKDKMHLCGHNPSLRAHIAKVTNNDEYTLAVFDLIAPVILSEEEVLLYDNICDRSLLREYMQLCGCSTKIFYADKHDIAEQTVNKYLTLYNGR